MKIVLDTNVLLVSISPKSKFHPIFKAFVNEEYNLYITVEILFEYEEIIKKYFGIKVAEHVLQLIENAPKVVWINNYYKWNLIENDPDDNKFTDCVIASNANFLVTNDKHFNILNTVEFPKVDFISAEKFLKTIKN